MVALLWLAARHPAPLERIADPSDTSYVPRPEWYFLPLFQLLKYFKGPFEPVGTAVLPGLAVLLLALVPWLDRGADRRPRARKRILAVGSAGAAAVVLLLFLGAADAPKVVAPSAFGPTAEPPPDPHLLGGALAYGTRGCASCHGPAGAGGPKEGFALVGRSLTGDETKLSAHFREKSPAPKKTQDEGANDPDKDLPSLIAYVSALSAGPFDLAAFPVAVRQGGAVIDRENCRQCHILYGEGGKRGPALARIASRRDKRWLVGHFIDPKAYTSGSKMPSFRDLPEGELAAMADYLLVLP
jgi:mono/diheme cytochrome c family protein